MAGSNDFSKLQYIDDTSPLINWSGSWNLVSRDGPFNGTLHSTNDTGASASFFFRGSFIFIALTLPACENGQSVANDGPRVQYYLSDSDTSGDANIACSGRNPVDLVDVYRMPVSGDPNQLHEIRITNRGSDPQYPLMLDRFAFLPLEENQSSSITFGPLSSTPTPTFISSTTRLSSLFSTTTPRFTTTITRSSSSTVDVTSSSEVPQTTSDISSAEPADPFTRVIIGSSISLAVLLLLGGIVICCLRRRARSRASLPADPFDDAYGQSAFLRDVPATIPSRTTRPDFFQQQASSSSSTRLNEAFPPLPTANPENRSARKATCPPIRPRSPNSLFDISRSSTPSRQCILGHKPEFNQCFCPSCDDRILNSPRRKQRGSSAMGSIAPSIASASTAAPAYARYRASNNRTSIDVRSIQSNPFSDVPPAYDVLDPIEEASPSTPTSSSSQRTTIHPHHHHNGQSHQSTSSFITSSSSSNSSSTPLTHSSSTSRDTLVTLTNNAVQVDDSSPLIQWTGDWAALLVDDEVGASQNTLHGTVPSRLGAEAEIMFNGSCLAVHGALSSRNQLNSSEDVIGVTFVLDSIFNTTVGCAHDTTPSSPPNIAVVFSAFLINDYPHHLRITSNGNQTFYLDKIEFLSDAVQAVYPANGPTSTYIATH
ncbi:hypothetical protein CVT24_008757 [Panaeolus cyanescens]|uniref:Uncharacterized protein n=1 Tax=Panaeolus cyanescens TaxID=181874 RepID=A0A409YX40_9AGAR|nr:hypothetical protein CVT24_008757 [Panaeolus cyanescens]